MTYKQKQRMASIVSRISTEARLEASTVLDLINSDLERIYQEKIGIHTSRLDSLERELGKLANNEIVMLRDLRDKESSLKLASSKVEAISAAVAAKSASLGRILQEVEELKGRLAGLNLSIREAAKAKGQLEYELITGRHRQREQGDKNDRMLHIVLAVFFLTAVAIAAFLTWKK